jgi:hypothetical protein
MLKMKSLMLFLLLFPLVGVAQNQSEEVKVRKCGHSDYVHMLMEADPGFAARRAQIEEDMIQWVKENPEALEPGQKVVYTIPVVVHVLYYVAAQNITHNRILEQIETLNKDFRRLNADVSTVPAAFQSKVADVEFQFCLAQRDPQGNWTNGVTRTQVTKTSYTYNDDNIIKSDALGGKSVWNPSKYLNIWVVNLTGGVLGYTQPPGGPASTDGVVICYKYFGSTGATSPFNKGRTATHEIGHWFNLIHIWGDDNGGCWGNDLVGDTPNQAEEFYGCPSYPQVDVCTPDSPGVMFMNFMDYVDDACMVMFTNGQKTRMLAALNASRSGLKTSDGCQPALAIEEIPDVSALTLYPNPGNGIFHLDLLLTRNAHVHLAVYNPQGQKVWDKPERYVSALSETLDLTHLVPGIYLLKVTTGEQTVTHKLVIR